MSISIWTSFGWRSVTEPLQKKRIRIYCIAIKLLANYHSDGTGHGWNVHQKMLKKRLLLLGLVDANLLIYFLATHTLLFLTIIGNTKPTIIFSAYKPISIIFIRAKSSYILNFALYTTFLKYHIIQGRNKTYHTSQEFHIYRIQLFLGGCQKSNS